MALASQNRKPGLQIAWKTVTYRSVVLSIVAVIGVLFASIRIAFPQFTQTGITAVTNLTSSALEKVAGFNGNSHKSGETSSQQAHFTALDGTVRVKKGSSNSWSSADYNLPLEKGDVVQTGSEGMAKIVFNDGTNYTVKQDSLIVIEENSANERQQTTVSVAVSTGTVDLATGTYVQGSKSEVILDGATASLAPDSAARVSNDPKTHQHEILLKKGTGEITRNGEVVRLADWEKVSFQNESPGLQKSREIGPPTPISPANMMPMANAAGYRLQISRNPYFSSTIMDKKVSSTDVMVSGLKEGAYYWAVQSYDSHGTESAEGEKNRFNIIPKDKDQQVISLNLDPFVQHGHVLELTGKTEVGARVMVNGREVPMVGSDGAFHYFTPPLAPGESIITITAQNATGGVNTLQKRVEIQ